MIIIGCMFVVFLIDEILVISNNSRFIAKLITKLNSFLLLKDMGDLKFFLGVEVTHLEDGLDLSQTKCLKFT